METTITSRARCSYDTATSNRIATPLRRTRVHRKREREGEREREREPTSVSLTIFPPALLFSFPPCLPPYLPISVPLSTHQVPPHRLRCLLRQRGRDRRGVRGNLHGRYATRTPLGNQLSSHSAHTLVVFACATSTHTTLPPLPLLRTMLLAPRLPPPRLPKPPPQELSP